MTKRIGDTEPYLAGAWRTAKRFDFDVYRFAVRARELASRRSELYAQLTALGVPSSTLEQLDEWDAQLAFADAELREMNDAFATAVRRLERERARNRALFASSEPSIVTDRAGAIDEANDAAATLLSVWQDGLRGKPLVGLVARQDTRAFREWLRTLDGGRQPGRIEVLLRPRGGAPFRARLTVRVLSGAVDPKGALHWTIHPTAAHPTVAPASGSLGGRVRRAIDDLRSSLSAVQTSARLLSDRVKTACDWTEIVEALAAAVALPTKPLEVLERLAAEVVEDDPVTAIRLSS